MSASGSCGSDLESSMATKTSEADKPLVTEDRVQVDRKLLELLIQDGLFRMQKEAEATTAEAFFQEVMTKTSTVIQWPSRLKIGAKTKKAAGLAGIVFWPAFGAKWLSTHLDPLSIDRGQIHNNRVTLKIDISFTDHSHIIGHRGQNTQTVMKTTGCHIHFPDSNRDVRFEKSNQVLMPRKLAKKLLIFLGYFMRRNATQHNQRVSVAGPAKSVETARTMLRELAPLSLTFQLLEKLAHSLSEDAVVSEVTKRYGVQVMVRSCKVNQTCHLLVRGYARDEQFVKEATQTLQLALGDKKHPLIATCIEVTSSQQSFVVGQNAMNVKAIEKLTGAQIRFPMVACGETTFYITGSLDAVVSARHYLIGCLPLVMIFELRSDYEPLDFEQLSAEVGLSISIKSKRGHDRGTGGELDEGQNVIVKGPEFRATEIYDIRSKFARRAGDFVYCKDFAFMEGFEPTKILQAEQQSSLQQPIQSANPPLVQLNGCLIGATTHSGLPILLTAPQRTTQSSSFGSPSSPVVAAGGSCERSLTPNFAPSPAQPFCSTPLDPSEPPKIAQTSTKPRPPALVVDESNSFSNGANSSGYLSCSRDSTNRSYTSSLSSNDDGRSRSVSPCPDELLSAPSLRYNGPPISPIDAPSAHNMIAAGIKNGALRLQEQSWKTVGHERKLRDYEQKKLFAAKAKQDKPTGIPRVPNAKFSGYFFSDSSPHFALQQHFALLNSAETTHLSTHVEQTEEASDVVSPFHCAAATPFSIAGAKQWNATTYCEQLMPSSRAAISELSGTEDVAQVLVKLGLAMHLDTFLKEEIDMDVFVEMSRDDLFELGIKNGSHLVDLLAAIEHLRRMKAWIAERSTAARIAEN